jgi:3-phenylpropionate/trans-cinnamate dioxygenase ferredoxin reductase component
MSDAVVIIGAGQAGAQAVQSLRAEGFTGAITMIGDEPYLPYQRPPLSKKFLAGELELERMFIRPAEFYAEAKVAVRLGVKATFIDRGAKRVRLSDGGELSYGQLVIATGSSVRKLAVPGADLAGLFYLRDIRDVHSIQAHFKTGARLVIVGAGYIGLEVAAVAVKRGMTVIVLEMMDRVMARVAAPVVSQFYEREHRSAGVDIRTRTSVLGFEGTGQVAAVRTENETVPADFVVIGVGIQPVGDLAVAAGLPCDNGIVVDEFARTADASIFAAGDCTNHPSFLAARRLRLESVQNAIEQAKAAASAMVGRPKPYVDVPWFWSDQYDLKLQIAGIADLSDERVLRGDPAARKFAVFHLRQGTLASVEAINAAPEFMMGRQLIAKRARIAPERLADVNIPMKALA